MTCPTWANSLMQNVCLLLLAGLLIASLTPQFAHAQDSETELEKLISALNPKVAPNLRPGCLGVSYTPVPTPDLLGNFIAGHKQYRLVIGAGKYLYDGKTYDSPFVAPSAALIDKALSVAGYSSLPSFVDKDLKFLVDESATKEAIRSALEEMASVTKGDDFGIVYYIGHGNISPGGSDIALGVYDREVRGDEGYHFSDFTGELGTGYLSREDVAEIPHVFIILDACFSGAIAEGPRVAISQVQGAQRLVMINGSGPIIPDKFAVLTSVAPGADNEAYELAGANVSAFSYYFARALSVDWACSDQITPDGILTLLELKTYLAASLKTASDANAIAKPMNPSLLKKDYEEFLAYRTDKYHEPGLRSALYWLHPTPDKGSTISLTLPGGTIFTCSNDSGCSVPISRKFENGIIAVNVLPRISPVILPPAHGGFAAVGIPVFEMYENPKTTSVKELRTQPLTIPGGSVSLEK